jgi:hypothetical protein
MKIKQYKHVGVYTVLYNFLEMCVQLKLWSSDCRHTALDIVWGD